MNPTHLQNALRAVEESAVLVPPQVIEKIIHQTWKLSGLFWTVPHRRSFIIDRQTLFRRVGQEELYVAPDVLLPPTLILLAWSTAEMNTPEPDDAVLLKYWQRLFHASVHLALENQWSEGRLTAADLRGRIEEIGATRFEEIRNVLVQDSYLPTSADERTVYIEFAAIFLEEFYFATDLLESTFPGLLDLEAMRKLLERDVDGEGLFRRTKLTGAADPVVQFATTSQEPHEYYYKLMKSSVWEEDSGNVVKSAIQKRRAARVAPPALAYDTMQAAQANMQDLVNRLKKALDMDDAVAAEWLQDLHTLLDKADQGTNPPEAALLYDLQRVCLDFEQDIYALDLVEWLLSMGKRPIKRPLQGQRLVRLTRHLASATQRLTMARLSDSDRKHLAGLLQNAQQRSETRLRERFRPVFVTALDDVGLKPRNAPERTAYHKMIEELLDRILTFGFLTFSDLRDALSRNLLKLPDLSEPHDFIRGDPLLQLDRRLATLLDGVYRRGDFYLRWLERFTALNFGTVLGRKVTQYVTLPFGAAFLLVAAIDIFFLQHWGVSVLPLQETQGASPLSVASAVGLVGQSGLDVIAVVAVVGSGSDQHSAVFSWYRFFVLFMPFWVPLAFFLMGLLHSSRLRQEIGDAADRAWRPLRALLVEGPIWLIRNPALKIMIDSWSFQLFIWVLKPACTLALTLAIWMSCGGDVYLNPPWLQLPLIVLLFVAVNLVLRFGPHAMVSAFDELRAGLIPTLFNGTIRIFKSILHLLEAVLFNVDEWLRFRTGDSKLNMALRAILAVLWFPISYLARLNTVLLLEPALNPVKLPVCLIAAKFWYPLTVALITSMKGYDYLTYAIVYYVWYMFPDFFGFLFWEVKENWSLYRANRSPTLQPIAVGPHGETLPKLLQPGFHAGTIPKLFARLRHAERAAYRSGNWSSVRSARAALEHIEAAIRLFVMRDFIALLAQDEHWKNEGLRVGQVRLATNRISIELIHPRFVETPMRLKFENCSGWLVAGLDSPGWLPRLRPEQTRPLHNAMVTLYKLSGVDLIREQLRTLLPAQISGADLTYQGLALRLDGKPTPTVHYDLRTPSAMISPKLTEGLATAGWPEFRDRQLLFRLVPVTWEECVRSWQSDPSWNGNQRLAHDVEVMPPSPPYREESEVAAEK